MKASLRAARFRELAECSSLAATAPMPQIRDQYRAMARHYLMLAETHGRKAHPIRLSDWFHREAHGATASSPLPDRGHRFEPQRSFAPVPCFEDGKVVVIGDEPENTIKDRRRPRLLCRGAKERDSPRPSRVRLAHSPPLGRRSRR
jgi:hypothetical protein